MISPHAGWLFLDLDFAKFTYIFIYNFSQIKSESNDWFNIELIVLSFVFLQLICSAKSLVTWDAYKYILSGVDILMSLQICRPGELLVTLIAFK